MAIGLLGPATVMARAQGFPELIEKFRFRAIRGSRMLPIHPFRDGRKAIDRNYFEWRFRPGHFLSPQRFLKRSDETFDNVTWIESYEMKRCNRIIL
jgi:hypothetical protein